MKQIEIGAVLSLLADEDIAFRFEGNESEKICGFSSLGRYVPGTVTWAKTEHHLTAFAEGVRIKLLVALDAIGDAAEYAENTIYAKEPKRAFFSVLEKFYTSEDDRPARGTGSCVSPKAKIGGNVRIGACCFIGDDVEIGDDVVIGNNVSIECKTHIGSGTRIGSGTVIGSAGFGFYKTEDGVNHRVRHFGGVWIGDDVDIGENCVINRGTLDDTHIGNNVKINASIQVAHNVTIGDRCLILGLIGGSCTIGEDSYIAPLALVKNQVSIGKHCMLNVGVFLTEDLPDGCVAHKNRVLKLDYQRLLHL